MSRYNGEVNGYFLCDRGRFGYDFVNDNKRIRQPQIRTATNKNPEETTEEKLKAALSQAFSGTKKWLGIGSPRASLEANFALSCLVGKENFYHGVSRKDQALLRTAIDILRNGTARSPSLKEIEKADAVLILGEDVTNTAPMTALAVRQAARGKDMEMVSKSGIAAWNDYARREMVQDLKSPIFIASPFETKLDDIGHVYRATPWDIARLGFAVAARLDKSAPPVRDLDETQQELAQRIAVALKGAKNPLIITGVHNGIPDLLYAAANITEALRLNGQKALISFLLPECNSMGLGMMDGKSLDDVKEQTDGGEPAGLIILENDLYRRADKDLVDSLFEKQDPVIVLDHLVNETTRKADILLPVGTFAESEGTLVNNEGRAQRFYRVLPPAGKVIESWLQIRDLIRLSSNSEKATWEKFDDIANAMTDQVPAFSKIKGYFPDADFRILNEKIKRQTIRFSGRTAINAAIAVSETKPPDDSQSPLAFTMEGSDEIPPSSLVSYYWLPGWNSYQAMNFYLDEPNGSMKGGDPGIRLIEASQENHLSFFSPVALPFNPKAGEWLIIPVYRIFGSEELSSGSQAIVERIEAPFILMNPADAQAIGGKNNDLINLALSGKIMELKLKIEKSIPPGIAGLSVGLPGMTYFELPGWGKLTTKKVK
jgi:NADH-quinone oxidoreductase subunit G